MKDGIAILFLIVLLMTVWPAFLQRHARGWRLAAYWFAPVVGFVFGWWAR